MPKCGNICKVQKNHASIPGEEELRGLALCVLHLRATPSERRAAGQPGVLKHPIQLAPAPRNEAAAPTKLSQTNSHSPCAMTGKRCRLACSHANASYCARSTVTDVVSSATPFRGGPGRAVAL